MRIAVLIPRGQLFIVEECLAEAEILYQHCGLTCELTGPWPAYSFATALALREDHGRADA